MLTMELAFTVVIGLAVGSFLNVVISRLPAGESVVHPRSRCPQCRTPIAGYDNIPMLSYLLLRGRCRKCQKSIPVRYPAIEFLTGVLGGLLYFKFGLGAHWLIYMAFTSAMIALAFIDADHRILPDRITLNGIWLGIAASLILVPSFPTVQKLLSLAGLGEAGPRTSALAGSLLGAAVGGGLLWAVSEAYLRLRGVEGMGFGDVKMMGMVGAFLGAPLALFTIMIGSVLGSIIGLVFMRLAGKSQDYELPFGTFLGFGAVVAVLYGNEMIGWYIARMFPPAL